MDPRELLERHTEEVWNQGNLAAVDRFIAPDYVEHDPSVRDELRGPEAYRQNVELFRSAFPDLSVRIEGTVVEGDVIALRQRFRGTHRGTFMDLEPTGNGVDAKSFVFCRIEDDRIAETWVVTDMLDVLTQLGVDLP